MERKMKCRKGLVAFYGLLVGLYFLGIFPFQLREIIEIGRQADEQNRHYQNYIRQQKHCEETIAYKDVLDLQVRSYEKEFFNYKMSYEGTERLLAFLSSYPIKNLQVIRESSIPKDYGSLTLREEIYQISYESPFYESYEIIQDLLRVTGDSDIQKVLVTHLDQPMVKTHLTFVLRLAGERNERA